MHMSKDKNSLTVFRDLTIRGMIDNIASLGDAIQKQLPSQWKRDCAKEIENASMFGDAGALLVFERSTTDDLPAAGVAMLTEGETVSVLNIVPLEKHQLSIAEYNALLVELTEQAIRPATNSLGLSCELGSEEKTITAWMSESAISALQRFSHLANHATGSSHPMDQQRWFAFLVQCHQDGCTLDTDILQRWLIEIGEWSPDRASDLAIEYEFAQALLKFAEHQR